MKANSNYELTFINSIWDLGQKEEVSQQQLSEVIKPHIALAYLILVSFDLRIKFAQIFKSLTDSLHCQEDCSDF